MNEITNFLLCFILQIAATLGLIFLFGKIIAICNSKFYSGFGKHRSFVCRFTGIIGTPIHEISHALFCIIFCHKITEIKFFQLSSDDGTLGYVNHTYNKKSLYQRIGNLFIGIAPIVVGSLILCGLLYLLLPEMFKEVCSIILQINFIEDAENSFFNLLTAFVTCFSCINKWQWWVFVIIGAFIALHMTLSKADIRGAMSGLVFFLIVLLLVDIILAAISEQLIIGFTGYIMIFGSFLLFFFILFLVIMLLLLLIQAIFRVLFGKHH